MRVGAAAAAPMSMRQRRRRPALLDAPAHPHTRTCLPAHKNRVGPQITSLLPPASLPAEYPEETEDDDASSADPSRQNSTSDFATLEEDAAAG